MLDFVLEIALNLFLLFTRKLFHKILPNFLGEILQFLSKLLSPTNPIEKPLQESSICPEVSFYKKAFFGFLELSLRRVGKQADIIHYNIKRKASEPTQINWKNSKI